MAKVRSYDEFINGQSINENVGQTGKEFADLAALLGDKDGNQDIIKAIYELDPKAARVLEKQIADVYKKLFKLANTGFALRESEQLNEAGSWGVEVQEPFSDKGEKAAMGKFKFVQPAITIVGASGTISEDNIDVSVQFSNNDQVDYSWTQSNGQNDPSEMSITDDQTNVDIDQRNLDEYLGSTGTVVGDMALMYRDYKLGKLK